MSGLPCEQASIEEISHLADHAYQDIIQGCKHIRDGLMRACNACAGAEGAGRAVHAGRQLLGNAQVRQRMHAAAVAARRRQPQGTGSAVLRIRNQGYCSS